MLLPVGINTDPTFQMKEYLEDLFHGETQVMCTHPLLIVPKTNQAIVSPEFDLGNQWVCWAYRAWVITSRSVEDQEEATWSVFTQCG